MALANFFGLGGPAAEVTIRLSNLEGRKHRVFEAGKDKIRAPVFDGDEPIGGQVVVRVPGGRLEHIGIKMELKGVMEVYQDRGRTHEFVSTLDELEGPGELSAGEHTYNFMFRQTTRKYESFHGINVRVRYFLVATLSRTGMSANLSKTMDFLVEHTSLPPETSPSINMEVGIESYLHLEFVYDREHYHLEDVLVGRVHFHLVRLRIKHMELTLLRRESTKWGDTTFTETEIIAKHEVMDGAPIKGETVPIRLFLSAYDLSPTLEDVNNTFSVRYFVNLVLVDENERRYFKQHEIKLYRSATHNSGDATLSMLKTLRPTEDWQGHPDDESEAGNPDAAPDRAL